MPYVKAGKKASKDAERIRSKYWVFTLGLDESATQPSGTEEHCNALKALTVGFLQQAKPTRFIFQIELGTDELMYIHAQGYMEFNSQKAFTTIKKCCNWVHIEIRKGTRAECVDYCSKTDGALLGPFYDGLKPVPLTVDPLHEVRLYAWQQCVLELADRPPDDRSIYWFWDQDGNVGKSALIKHMMLVRDDCAYCFGLKWNDVACHIMDAVVPRSQGRSDKNLLACPPRIILLDIPRSGEASLNLAGLEQVKNGLFFSGKYEPRVGVFNPPHIFVFANYPPPDPSLLSLDRWKVARIEGKHFSAESLEIFNDNTG